MNNMLRPWLIIDAALSPESEQRAAAAKSCTREQVAGGSDMSSAYLRTPVNVMTLAEESLLLLFCD